MKANLKEANLEETNLEEANFRNAILEATKLTAAQNLSVEQLSKVKTLLNAKLDKEILTPLEKKYPNLFRISE